MGSLARAVAALVAMTMLLAPSNVVAERAGIEFDSTAMRAEIIGIGVTRWTGEILGARLAEVELIHTYKNVSKASRCLVLSRVTFCEYPGPLENEVALLFLASPSAADIEPRGERVPWDKWYAAAGMDARKRRIAKLRSAAQKIRPGLPVMIAMGGGQGKVPLHLRGNSIRCSPYGLYVKDAVRDGLLPRNFVATEGLIRIRSRQATTPVRMDLSELRRVLRIHRAANDCIDCGSRVVSSSEM